MQYSSAKLLNALFDVKYLNNKINNVSVTFGIR